MALGGDDDSSSADIGRQLGDDESGSRDEASDGTSVPTATPRTTTTTARSSEAGTRENPLPVGTPLKTSEGWEVVINGVDFEAADGIAAQNQFNDPAPPGLRYVLVNATITNSSTEPGYPDVAVSIEMIGSQNRVWDGANAFCSAVIPEPISNAGELFPGGGYTGNACLQVPEAEVADGSLLLVVGPAFGDTVFVRTS